MVKLILEIDFLYYINGYKSTRDPSKKPINLSAIKQMIKDNYRCEIAVDEEADDIISRMQYQSYLRPGSFICISPDKDCNFGIGPIYNPQKDYIRDCSGFGHIELIVKESVSGSKTYKLDGAGRSFFYFQLVVGDKVDSYNPFKPAKTAYKFYQEFKDIKTDKEAWQYIYDTYKNYFGEITEWTAHDGTIVNGDIIDLIQVYVDVVHMRRWDQDRPLVRDILKKMEVVL